MNNYYIILIDRGQGDRIGSQITWYICQIIYAHYNNYYIDINYLIYKDSIFMQAIKKYIDLYNKNKIKGNYINFIENDLWCQLNSKVVCNIESDLISYFKNNLSNIRDYLDDFAFYKKYSINFNPSETILIHLRLDDINYDNRIDYDGTYSLNYFIDKINNKNFNYDDEIQTYKNLGIVNNINLYNTQAPLNDYKIINIIENIKKRYPIYKILIIASPKGNITLPYPTIRSNDPSIDLFYLCNCDFVILSKSTFALSSVYFSRAKEIWIPTWGYVGCLGLQTKYNNSNFKYFN